MYFDYYCRTVETLWPTMLAIGVKLGVITLRYESYEYPEEGEPIPVGDPIVIPTKGGAWDFIGIIQETGTFLIHSSEDFDTFETVDLGPITDLDGAPYWHGNLRTTTNLAQVATVLSETDPEIAAVLGSLGDFFLLDAEGNARLPSQPHRVWAGE